MAAAAAFRRAVLDPARRMAGKRPMLNALIGEMPRAKRGIRLHDLDAARGIAIVLVVVGHVVARDVPPGNEWYAELKRVIYLFHMPLFMALSGITFAMSLPRFARWSDVLGFSARRIERLLLPYLFFGALIVGGKLVMVHFVHVDNLPSGTLRDLLTLLVYPASSAAGFLWFIYVLSWFIALVPALFHLAGARPALLLAFSIPLSLLDAPPIFMLDRVVEYLPFFALGMVVWAWRPEWPSIDARVASAAWALFASALVASFWLPVPKWLAGLLSVPATLALAQRLPPAMSRLFCTLGIASLAIYLMNTIIIGLAKGVLLLAMPWQGLNFLVFFPLLLIAAIVVPMVLRSTLPRLWAPLSRYL